MRTDPMRCDGDPRPLYCPACRRSRRTEGMLCAHCGDPLIAEGYCPVCRCHWLLPEGSNCPKHDLPLGKVPPQFASPFGEDETPTWATVATFSHALEAEAPRHRLEWEGIPTFLDGERMAGHSGGVAGGVRLQVPGSRIDQARDILNSPWGIEEDDDETDGLEEALDHPPGRSGPIWWGVGLFAAVVVLRGALAIWNL